MYRAVRLLLLFPVAALLLGPSDGTADQKNTADFTGKAVATVNGTAITSRESNAYIKSQQGRPALLQHEDQPDRHAIESSFSSHALDGVHGSASLPNDGDRLLAFEKSADEPLLNHDKSPTHRQASDARQSPPPSPTAVAASEPPSRSPKKESAMAPPSGWAVQVGSFSKHKNAASLRKELRRAGFPAFEERVVSGGQQIFRVKVGPAENRERAEALQAMLRKQKGLNGIVVSHSFAQSDALVQAPPDQKARDKSADDRSEATRTDKKKKLDERLGEAPDEDFREVFLRESLVLLAPGEVQLEFSLDYLRDTFGNIRTREGSLFSTVRVGLPFGFEAFIDVPYEVREQEIFVATENSDGGAGETTVIDDDHTGIGDIQAGLNFILLPETETWPNIIGTLAYAEPTGEEPDLTDPLAAVFGPANIALGTGRRSGTAGLSFVKSSDPAVLFGGLQFTYRDTESVGGIEIEGGHQFAYRFGMGFAINDELTMSGLFNGAYLTETKLNGQPVLGSDLEPWTFRTGLTYAFRQNQYIEPAVTFALNDDAVDAIANLAYVVTF